MLSSLNSREEGEQDPHPLRRCSSPYPSPRQLLIRCAELIHHADLPAARRAISLLSAASSPFGDSADRIVHQFTRALSLQVDRLSLQSPLSTSFPSAAGDTDEAIQSSYLHLNQITPFLRFAHLTANQAILEAVDGHRRIHILDFDTSHGVQWPPLLQAIADRSDPSDPPSIRITGTGTDMDVLRRTAHRLHFFANSLNLPFHFHPLLVPSSLPTSAANSTSFASFQLHSGETLAVNCVFFLHKLIKNEPDCYRDVRSFLRSIRALNPAVVTMAEREASHNSPAFLQRFIEALEHYTVVFESLEATLPPTSRERMVVERVWLGREIAAVVAGEDRFERFEKWEEMMRAAGLTAAPLSPFAVSQARLLLRLHYPSEGYQLQVVRDSCFLGWQTKPLFSVEQFNKPNILKQWEELVRRESMKRD
ncbi:Scarecrow-like protein 18 [Apostasia shenzhenica]|uniref:Scarecrow-like protein 18 n=1 Tax=Apostasia shenzhenica TaxID=1088818 RepID=A0A2I0AB86_9ASPA|nr:Scarecrow-like protein 18 [Apostasia shenzhenica]